MSKIDEAFRRCYGFTGVFDVNNYFAEVRGGLNKRLPVTEGYYRFVSHAFSRVRAIRTRVPIRQTSVDGVRRIGQSFRVESVVDDRRLKCPFIPGARFGRVCSKYGRHR